MPKVEPKVALVITRKGLDNVSLLGPDQLTRQEAIQLYQTLQELIDWFGEAIKDKLEVNHDNQQSTLES